MYFVVFHNNRRTENIIVNSYCISPNSINDCTGKQWCTIPELSHLYDDALPNGYINFITKIDTPLLSCTVIY